MIATACGRVLKYTFMRENHAVRRTALSVRCTAEEAELIRQASKAERRTISGYILNGILQRIAVRDKAQNQFRETFSKTPSKTAAKKAKTDSSGI
jgi:uncharacterized protein (DUF1778 family)